MAESEEELNTLLTKVKEESEKSGLNPAFKNLRSWHMVITSWQKDGEKMETATDFIFLGSKITVDGDCTAMKLKDNLHIFSLLLLLLLSRFSRVRLCATP